MTRYLILALTLTAVLCGAPLAFSQGDMLVIKSEAFTSPQRPPAVFPHDAHNEKAKIDDCAACHHGGENGKRDPKATSEGTPCADCHSVTAAPGRTPLMRAYHQQCIGCHMQKKAGPVACGQCHVDAAAPAAK